jgi:hypothetical protein
MKNPNFSNSADRSLSLDLDDLLHPAQAFDHPCDVVADADLTLNEKRAILASWASDACAVEAAPALRCPPGTPRPVPVDEILEALRALDKEAHAQMPGGSWLRRQARRRSFDAFRARRRHNPGNDLTH